MTRYNNAKEGKPVICTGLPWPKAATVILSAGRTSANKVEIASKPD